MAYQEKYIINKPLVAGLRKGGMWRGGGGSHVTHCQKQVMKKIAVAIGIKTVFCITSPPNNKLLLLIMVIVTYLAVCCMVEGNVTGSSA